jgi:hypothetical protein
MDSEQEPNVTEKKVPEPLLIDPDECLDWDFAISEPPPKRKGTIRVRLVYKRVEPLPLLDPDED